MDIKKGISYIAFGFLFTLLNINLNFNGTSINITPDFVGWILMFLAFDHLGQYVENKGYLKWIALILAILTGVIWVYGLVKPELSIDTVKTVVSFAGVVFMFILFLSRLDAHMIEFNNSDIDLAYTFEGHCQMGWAKSMKPGVNYVVEVPYEHLVVNIDDGSDERVNL